MFEVSSEKERFLKRALVVLLLPGDLFYLPAYWLHRVTSGVSLQPPRLREARFSLNHRGLLG